MTKIRAAITGVGGYVPDYILTNDELSRMVDTSDEWIMTRIGIKERRILKGEGKGTSDMGAEAVKELLRKTNTKPEEVDMLICGVVTPDMLFPATANIIADKTDIRNAFGYDMNAGCSSFLYALTAASKFVESGSHKKVIVVGADKMSSIVDYTDRATCPIFGDGAAAVMLEPVAEDYGVMDAMLQSDGVGRIHLHQKAGGSVKPPTHQTIDAREHYIYQEGQAVFKWAVSKMADVSVDMMKKHGITSETLNWLVPHQANMRIIEATAQRMGIKREQVMINIQRYGNTTSATLPLCLWEWENQLRRGDNIILAAFGAGFTWGAVYVKWAYDGDKVVK
ncbi:3-oxoacyl-(acyl-carrier-protein) synthase III [Lentimicrobium saccharophilum]|uniref:Beta-ketoacyl-[acyl-carrier-protein] synthase III n=1 Tax=Lentimicrobium saccharophilum TaxID=1678841 RepID=A0A0S7BZW3_9BACT|nr:beta-ketoacyl-ACP synthase III [Lentimicrobium saccharophilum]GAP41919.1 3-oxoacyl-(acyl-carrier-protein) synthase III [Lentimicrobium saccharophilum]